MSWTPTSASSYRIIKLACKGERVDVDWDGTYADLTRLFTDGTHPGGCSARYAHRISVVRERGKWALPSPAPFSKKKNTDAT